MYNLIMNIVINNKARISGKPNLMSGGIDIEISNNINSTILSFANNKVIIDDRAYKFNENFSVLLYDIVVKYCHENNDL